MIHPLHRARATPAIRGGAQAAVIALLAVACLLSVQRSGEQESQTAAVSAILAQSCEGASQSRLQAQGLVEECRLAQEGALPDAISADALSEPTTTRSPGAATGVAGADRETSTAARPTVGPVVSAVDKPAEVEEATGFSLLMLGLLGEGPWAR